MDHKKVGNFAAYDENLNLIRDGSGNLIPFMAEFCDGYFGGDITASNGTFSGTLTATAVNAADNINISGNAVATSTAGTIARMPVSGYFPEGQTASVFSFNFSAVSTLGTALLRVEFKVDQADSDNSAMFFTYRHQLQHNGGNVYDTGNGNLLYATPRTYTLEFILSPTTGVNQVQLLHSTSFGDTTPYAYITGISYSLDYIRK